MSAFHGKEHLYSQGIYYSGDSLIGLEKACAKDELTWEVDYKWRLACRKFCKDCS